MIKNVSQVVYAVALSVMVIATSFIGNTVNALNTHSIDLEWSSSQSLSAADASAFDISGNMTIEAWIKRESTGGQTLVCKMNGDGGSSVRSYCLALELTGSNAIDFLVSNGTTHQWGSVSQSIATGAWHHVAVVYTASAGTAEFFYDGSSLGTATGYPTTVNNTSEAFRIGGDGFDGLIDDIRLWNVARSGTEITDDKSRELNGNETGLVGYWKLNNSLADTSASGNTLTNNGSAAHSVDSAFTGFSELLKVRKSANESLVNSTILQNDDHLKLSLAANKTYIVDGVLFASSTSATPDIMISFFGQTDVKIRIGYTNDVNEMVLNSGVTSSRIVLPANTPTSIHIKGTVKTEGTSGDFQLKWAQSTSNSNPTTVMEGSYLKAEEI